MFSVKQNQKEYFWIMSRYVYLHLVSNMNERESEHTITWTEQDVLIWHFLYLHRTDIGMTLISNTILYM